MPTAAVLNYSGRHLIPLVDPDKARRDVVNLEDGTYLMGTVIGQLTATPGTYGPYLAGEIDGTAIPTHILEYDCVVASGIVYFGDTVGGEWSTGSKGAPAYRNGIFASEELVGMDAAGLALMQGRVISGTIVTGRVLIPGA